MSPTLIVAMLTYRRPDDLAIAVQAFLAEAGRHDAQLLVVDNDPDGSAREQVELLGAGRARYVHEPRPGIAAGRNRALAEAGTDLLVFVDDDETPAEGWLDALLTTYGESAPAAVVGAVVSEFVGIPAPWIIDGGFFDRRRLPTGTLVDVAATNNLLLDLRQVRALGLSFDERFGLSGGSDTLFSRALVRAGGRMVWCDEAVVLDRVPPDRMTRTWLLARARRSGNSASRAELALAVAPTERLGVRARYVFRGVARVLGGAAQATAGTVSRTDVTRLLGRRRVQRGIGMITGALGQVVFEYSRSTVAVDEARP